MSGIDAHQHFWQYSTADYPWIGPGMETIRRNFLPRDLRPLLEAAGLTHSIAVQARQTLEETRWLLQLADESSLIHGVVGWVDLQSTELPSQLAEFASHPRFVGVRHVAQDEPDDRFLIRPEVVAGIRQLKEYGLTYDLLIYPRQLPAAIELVCLLPDQPFVMDHLAKPVIRDGLMEPWASQLRALASNPNVCCKVSGMVTEAAWSRWERRHFDPYLDVVFEAFGPERLMFGSDWPVCLVSGEYAAVVELVRDYVRRRSPQAETLIFDATARQLYQRRH